MHTNLTPLQKQIVDAPLSGEIVVGGAAGSGKTTAAVYRAAYLCERTPRRKNESTVLFLCFNTLLAATIQRAIGNFPSAVWSRVQVRTMHSWCAPDVARRFPDYTALQNDSERLTIVREALRETRMVLGRHEVFERDPQVFLDEIRLIKGCGILDLDDYQDRRIARTGALEPEDYQVIFSVAQTYDRLLRARQRLDFDDFALITLGALQQARTSTRVDHVIVDEGQDLSDRQLALARSLPRQSLLIVADQDQAIYRVTQLPNTLPATHDYNLVESLRTTAEIWEYASRLLPNMLNYRATERHGPPPACRMFQWNDQEAAFIAEQITHLLAEGIGPATIAILARRRDLLPPITAALARLDVPVAADDPQIGPVGEGIQLLTIHGAKGRGFQAVFVPGMVEGVLPCMRPEMDRAASGQELALARRQLYVAMTRAHTRLWLTGSEGRPSRLLYELGMLVPEQENTQ